MTILQVNDLVIQRDQHLILDRLTFQLEAKQRLFLEGEIGAGKSTLLHSLLGFIPYQSGEIRWFDQPCKQEKDFVPLRGKVGICFQNPDDQLFGPTVIDDIAFGPLNQGLSTHQAYQLAQQQLERLEITYLKDRPINLLSGGEKNFTALAGVLAMQPRVLLLDEPTNGLDKKSIEKLTALLLELDLPLLIASHDEGFTQTMAQERLMLSRSSS